MSLPTDVAKLIDRFHYNRTDYKSGKYNETQVRREFIDPFFKALGWDVDNEKGYAEAYKDVVHEDAIKVGRATKAPDYSFRIGGVRKFFLEAKKPSVDIKHDTHPAYQLRRYAWSAKLPLSILTDFEEFAVYDGRIKPDKSDNAANARIMYLTYQQYAEQWPALVEIFSPEAIRRGAFDKFTQSTKIKKGTAEVDHAFLQEIERWREVLARNLALRNSLSQRQLNFAVQLTIDRLIFLRIAEDRGIEPYGQLRDLGKQKQTYQQLLSLFQRADDRYNSGLFHFQPEKGRDNPDTLTPTLTLDDKTLQDIVKNLYYPDSPYEFSVLPADILGQVYEQFLGKVIRLTAGGRAKVEDKPEVKKAGGVFYTPTYIVDYIVEQTVGQLLTDKTPPQIRGKTPLHILDPACGSGSFLLGAYQFLLNWYQNQYINDPQGPERWQKSRPPRLYQNEQGKWQLTTEERKQILVQHIFGVDIDPQAVEVTKLSLLLKVLEGENEQSLRQLSLVGLGERVLPDLDHNIKCGNSLIGPDFYDNQPTQSSFLADEEELYRINAFDWQAEFAEIMQSGGFDAVIGNPPYIRIQAMKEWAPKEVEFYKDEYVSASKGNYDIYVVFVEKGLDLLNKTGLLGYILPHKFFNAKYGQTLRHLISEGQHLQHIIHFGDQQIFANATTYTCLLFLNKTPSQQFHFVQAHDLESWRLGEAQLEGDVPATKATAAEWNFVVGPGADLFQRLSEMPTKLGDVTDRIFQGLKTGADKVFIVNELERNNNKVKIFSKQNDTEYWLEDSLLHSLIKGGDSKRYSLTHTTRLIIFPYLSANQDVVSLIPEKLFKEKYPLTWAYFADHKSILENRERGKMRGSSWFAYSRNQALDVISLPKIFTPDIAPVSSFSLDEIGETFFTGGVAGGYGILVSQKFSREYILALMNSKLLEWVIYQTATQMRGGWYSYESRFIRQLPIRTINFDDPDDKATHDALVNLVEQMLALHKQLNEAQVPQARTMLKRQIETTDRQIDRLVYQLYGLTEEEIRIVEGG